MRGEGTEDFFCRLKKSFPPPPPAVFIINQEVFMNRTDERVTMKNVARLAGVSLGTVSNVINNYSSVKDENRKKVQKAMEDLKFVPNMMAKQLRSNRSSVIGLILPTISNPYYPIVAQGVSDEATAKGYSTLLCMTNRNSKEEVRILNELLSRQVAGIIIAKSQLRYDELCEYSKKIKIVLLDYLSYPSIEVDAIATTNYEGTLEAVRYICRLGHRNIAYMAGDLQYESANQRLQAYRDGLRQQGLENVQENVSVGQYSMESGYERGLALLSQKNRPTAVLCANEMIAVGLYQAAEQLNIKIPQDLSVIGCDHTMLSVSLSPKLTTIDQQMQAQGSLAVSLLLEEPQPGQYQKENGVYVLKTQFIENQSCGVNMVSCLN